MPLFYKKEIKSPNFATTTKGRRLAHVCPKLNQKYQLFRDGDHDFSNKVINVCKLYGFGAAQKWVNRVELISKNAAKFR